MSFYQEDLDVLLVTYNSEPYLAKCISALRAGIPSAHINVVDNASTDSTRDILKTYDLASLRLNDNNRMLSEEWNRFLRESSRKYILLINPDGFITNGDFIERAICAMERDNRYAVAARIHLSTLGSLASWRAPVRPADSEVFMELIANSPWVRDQAAQLGNWRKVVMAYPDGSCMILRRDFVLQIGGFEETLPLYFNDAELGVRLLSTEKIIYPLWDNEDGNFSHVVGGSSRCDMEEVRHEFNNAAPEHFISLIKPLIPKCKVTVVLPTYNHIEYLPQAVDSIMAQRMTDFELIIVNDGSTDTTEDYLATLKDPRIKLINRENGGLPSALNCGFAVANGEYYTWTSADNYAAPTWLETLANSLDSSDENIGFVCSAYALIDQDGIIIDFHRNQVIEYDRMIACNAGISSFMYKAVVADKVGCYDESLTGAEDWDMWLRILEVCNCTYVDDILYYYRIHNNSMTISMPRRVRDSSLRVVEKILLRQGGDFNLDFIYPCLRAAFNQDLARWQAKTRLAAIIIQSRFCLPALPAKLLIEALQERYSEATHRNLILLLCRSHAWEMALQSLLQYSENIASTEFNRLKELIEERNINNAYEDDIVCLKDEELVFELGHGDVKLFCAPASRENLLGKAVAYHLSGDFNSAEAIYKNLLQAAPDDFVALHMLGVVNFQRNELICAEHFLTRALSVNSITPEAHYNLGNVFAGLGRREEARACYARALELNKDFSLALQQLETLSAH